MKRPAKRKSIRLKHPLRAWREKHDVSLRDFLDMVMEATPCGEVPPLGVHPSHVSKVERGIAQPTYGLMLSAFRVSKGEIMPNDFFDLGGK